MNFSDIKNIHFVGIGGIGMSGIAEVLANAGVAVSGCDLKRSAATDMLENHGIDVKFGHDASHITPDVELVVTTAAVRGQNPEVDAAIARGIRVMRRSEALGAIVNEKRAVGVAGTHGKTTTSSMVSMLLEDAGLDPTVLVGGIVRNLGTNAKTGRGEFLVVEADEYDRTFHQLHPEVAVVTNIEADHLEYYGTFEAILEAFEIYLRGVKPGGAVIGCIDDPHVASLLEHCRKQFASDLSHRRRVIGYGFSEKADVRAVGVTYNERGASFEVPAVGYFKLFVPGEHNVLNALAAIAVGSQLGIETGTLRSALARFLGVERRFQILGEARGITIVDDYAHHPTEIRATLNGARRGYPSRRIVALFQPHLFSRTSEFAREFGEALAIADVALVSPVFAAREQPIAGVTSQLIADAVPSVEYVEGSNVEIAKALSSRLQAGDLFIAMGAGDVHEIAEWLVEEDQR
ncbi:MAG: UDP-N-acetylmuramate--L-alanine ligase [Thermoanaerobaculia bacterium]